jgi:RND family efflux transporter MFP subunit
MAVDTSLALPLHATGVLAAREETDLAFTVGGVVAEVSVRPGDRVRRGQVLARLDAAQVNAQVDAATAQLDKAERDLARAVRLLADSVVTRTTADDARTARDAAAAALAAARFAQRTAVITAPADGVVLERRADPGTVVGAGGAVLRFGGSGEGTVFRAALPDRDRLRVRVGDLATVTLDAARDEVLSGRVVEVAAAPTPGTGTWSVEIAVPAAATLPRGLTGTATIQSGAAATVRLIPIEAVVEANQAVGIVFTIENGMARRHQVQLGAMDDGQVVVRDGLATGARVITAGAAWLSDGEAVQESTR